jgi:hypothetical protein
LLAFSSAAQPLNFNFSTNGRRVCLVEASSDPLQQSVTLHFLDAAANTQYPTQVYRRRFGDTGADWVLMASNLPPGTPSWTDSQLLPWKRWEYMVKRTGSWTYGGQTYDATAHTMGAIDDEGGFRRMILLVADDVQAAWPGKIDTLVWDLRGGLWEVDKIVVPAAAGWDSRDTVVAIKNQLVAAYQNAPANKKPSMLYILGHVPLPRSGSTNIIAPDDHAENKGARGADCYYADIDGIFTDTATYNPGGLATPLAVNLPGDFRWDADTFPSEVEMAFGRVDFRDLTEADLPEMALYGRYLDRAHAYKHVAPGTYMGNRTAFHYGYDNSTDGALRSLPSISTADSVVVNTSGAPHPTWVQANGPFMMYLQNVSVPEYAEWITHGIDATVYSSDQSYWGFGDVPQAGLYSRIRALLAANTRCLATYWMTTGLNVFHPLCVGEPIRVAMQGIMNHNRTNNNLEKAPQDYDTEDWWNRSHFALYGDPALRLHQVAPPSNLQIAYNSNAVLSWTPSLDPRVVSYELWGAASPSGPYDRRAIVPGTATTVSDPDYQVGDWYMLQAIVQQETGCGTFMNPSQGIFVQGTLVGNATKLESGFEIMLFPHPAVDHVRIHASQPFERLELYDIAGRRILQQQFSAVQTFTLETRQLAAGTYLLQLSGETGIARQQLVVAK